ncbi:MAG: hypothetical protein KDA64_09020 [Rhodospirillaceae bacterium]|nr:hypothetical protein [Rhodospirillaceae bacterium]
MDTWFAAFEMWHWLVLGGLAAILVLPILLFIIRATTYALHDQRSAQNVTADTPRNNNKIDRILQMTNER